MSVDHDLFHDALVRGIAAAKSHSFEEARYYLEWALRQNPDPDDRTQVLLWLSEVAANDAERRGYLEEILSYDPTHPTARRGIAILDGRLRKEEIIDPEQAAAPAPAGPEPLQTRRFVCPKCGGTMGFVPEREKLVCQYCGHAMSQLEALQTNPLGEGHDFIISMAKAEGHRWQQAGYSIKCEGCGASTVLPPGQISEVCPFCGSTHVVRVEMDPDVIEPDGMIRFQLSPEQAVERFRAWLGKRWFCPPELQEQAKNGQPRAVYVPFWAFDFMGDAHWSAMVAEGTGRYKQWVQRNEDLPVIEDGVLVPASHTLPAKPLRALDEFDLTGLEPYTPDKIANWPAEIYTVSMADASIVAREKLSQKMRRKIDVEVLGDSTYHSLQVSTLRLGTERYHHLLLPVWVFSYGYQGKTYHVLVNGQTGETEGEAPLDQGQVNVALAVGAFVIVAFIAVVLILLTR